MELYAIAKCDGGDIIWLRATDFATAGHNALVASVSGHGAVQLLWGPELVAHLARTKQVLA